MTNVKPKISFEPTGFVYIAEGSENKVNGITINLMGGMTCKDKYH